MTLIYIIGFVTIATFSLRSIAKSLKRGANSYEYSKSEIRTNYINENYGFDSKE